MKTLKIARYPIRFPGTPADAHPPCSMAVLADLHNAQLGPRNEILINAIDSVQPVAVLSAGDLVLRRSSGHPADNALELLDALATRYPVYCVNGNHETRMSEFPDVYGDDYCQYERGLEEAGVCLLRNASREVTLGGRRFVFHGLELGRRYYRRGPAPRLPVEEIQTLLGPAREGACNILLAHNPEYFPVYAQWGADLTLSGHLHGGMIRLPRLGGVIAPSLMPFPRYDHGLYEREGRQMVVSAGLASHTINIRINNPPELVVLDIL